MAIALRGQQEIEPVVESLAAHVADENWHEVGLLAVGHMGIIQQRDEAAGAVLWDLIQQGPGEPGEAAVFAGEAVLDAWPGGVTLGCKKQVVQALHEVMIDDAQVKAHLRAAAGDTLAHLGDPRFAPEAFWLPHRFQGEPEPLLGFLPVPAGEFQMGGTEGESEQPLHPVELDDYYIACYPVTVAQFRAFVDASGFQPDEPRSLRDPDNRPVRWVSWHEARAYCDWLTEALRAWEELPPELAAALRDKDWTVRLPTEAEWEKAASWDVAAGRKGEYPWGDEFGAERCNTWEGGVRDTSAVGAFPGGANPCEALDMAGNVFEWCHSLYQSYPYRVDDGREDPQAGGSRVLRGGSWSHARNGARCAYRLNLPPGARFNLVGFRVVVAPALPS